MNIKKIIREEVDDFDWVKDVNPKITDRMGDELDINTSEAQNNFDMEKNGYYAISTPKGQDGPETIISYGSLYYIKQVLGYLDDIGANVGYDLYLGKLEYSKKDKDNVLDFIKYY